MLVKKKRLNLKKKIHFGTFFGKIDFWPIFVKLKIFWDQGTSAFFFSPFSYQSGPKLLIYAKKIIKNNFRRIA
jgi:hypothetical protein